MSGICDNFLSAFAIHLGASVPQIAWLTAIPQMIGAWLQLLSVWVGLHCARKSLIVAGAALQALVLPGIIFVAAATPVSAVSIVIACAVLYHTTGNFIQPHWRALMGGLVPARRRGRFFAHRTRLAMITAFTAFASGGLFLNYADDAGHADLGFALLFFAAFSGRAVSAWFLSRMHDPAPQASADAERAFHQTWRSLVEAAKNRTFRDYTFFVAGMQGMVALSAPFFSVYMLRGLEFSYLQFTANIATSILVQFLTLGAWGRVSDHLGNRVVIIVTSLLIPLLPALWIVSESFWYLLCVQVLAGIAWSGFSLSTSNYLYDLRPHHTHFATYAAVQSGLSATAIFCGALTGGYLASIMPASMGFPGMEIHLRHPLLGVFAVSAVLRLLVALWFIPRAQEPRVRRRPHVRELVYRIARYTPITGVALDWLTVTRRKLDRRDADEPMD